MDSTCARCDSAFHCGANDTAPCACNTLKLDAATLATLRARYESCLCLACLRVLSTAPHLPEMKKAGPVW